MLKSRRSFTIATLLWFSAFASPAGPFRPFPTYEAGRNADGPMTVANVSGTASSLKPGVGSNGGFSSARRSSDGRFSARKSASGVSGLPSDAQGPVAAALGKDDPIYWLRQNPEGFRGENSQHTIVTEFTRHGAAVSGEAPGHGHSHIMSWGLETHAYGYGDALYPVKAVPPRAVANRVEYRRDGMTEWYENGPLGLEQGFTLSHPPERASANRQPLTLELTLVGDLIPTLEPGARGLALASKDGAAALRYTGLAAHDASGRELPSRLELHGEKLLVRVEDQRAQYPVVIDPWIQTAELAASDGTANDQFGDSMAISGSTLIVGAPYHGDDQGAAYVFVKSGATWGQQAELTPSDAGGLDYFGRSVAISGNTVVVNSAAHNGTAYVFVRSGTTWSQQAELNASDEAFGDGFATSVAVSGSTILVGASGKSVGSGFGTAYVFVNSNGTWTQQAELNPADEGGDYFGSSVALYGSTAVIGAPTHQVGSNSQQGAAYVYAKSGTTWSQQAELIASDGAANDHFGTSVALYASTAVVGANYHTVGSNQSQGAAYVFVKGSTVWSQQAELLASDGAYGDYFGSSVALYGSTVAVGAPYHPSSPPPPWNGGPGAAYVFAKSGSTWSQQAELLAANSDVFGASVAVTTSTAVVGASGAISTAHGGTGAAYVFGSSGPLYTLSDAPNNLSMAPGGQATTNITIKPFNGFSGSVSLFASSLPNGVTAAFSPNPATSTSTLTLTASATATEGPALVVVNGTSGTLTQTTPLSLTVLPAPEAKLSPVSMNFNNEVINTTSSARTVTIKNIGQTTLNFTSAPVIQPATNFKISSDNCGSLFPGQSCQLGVAFSPTALGKLTASLLISDDAAGSPQSVSLAGVGVQPATLTPASATYSLQKVGTTSVARTFTLTNYQSVALTGIAISTTGDFASTTTCGASLAVKGKCTISVTFTPSQKGVRTGQLIVKDSANNSPQISNLKGTGN